MKKTTLTQEYWARWAVIGGLMLLSTTAMAQDFGQVDGIFQDVGGGDSQHANLGLFAQLVATAMFAIENWAAPLISFFLGANGLYKGFGQGDWGRAGQMIVGCIIFAVFPLFMSTAFTFGTP